MDPSKNFSYKVRDIWLMRAPTKLPPWPAPLGRQQFQPGFLLRFLPETWVSQQQSRSRPLGSTYTLLQPICCQCYKSFTSMFRPLFYIPCCYKCCEIQYYHALKLKYFVFRRETSVSIFNLATLAATNDF